MDYYLHSQGRNLGIFPVEELRRRREAGQLTGVEYVWCKGMPNWQPLDLVLQGGRPPVPAGLPPLPAVTGKKSRTAFWATLAVIGGVVIAVLMSWGIRQAVLDWQRQILARIPTKPYSRANYDRGDTGVDAASKPVVIASNTMTATEVAEQDQLFRNRQWIDAYEKHGRHTAAWDADARQLIGDWQARNRVGGVATNTERLDLLADKLARESDDPLVLTVAALNCNEVFETQHRLDAALTVYPRFDYPAYPQLYASVWLARDLRGQRIRLNQADATSLKFLERAFADGSFQPGDQRGAAEIFINGWGSNFFYRNSRQVCGIVGNAGPDYKWLALVLQGEFEITEAWQARGGGYANTVTDAGWQGFKQHLAAAREDLTAAWKMHPEYPTAPERMIYVSLGDAGIDEMRLWFDRTVAAQVDYPRAWSDFRWGLRPRWYGSRAAILALGITALNTHRFDTDVPRKLFDSIEDLEGEQELPVGQHIYDRADIWPHMQTMYEGYIAEPKEKERQAGWRSTYAAVAYLAGKYDVARQQLEAVNWQPWTNNLSGWGRDLSLMPLEVAARTGLLGRLVGTAEGDFRSGNLILALQQFSEVQTNSLADVRTRAFVETRLAQVQLEQRLHGGDWIDWLPSGTNDPLWVTLRGQYERQPDGALEVQADKDGHMFYCRARVGINFEVRGEFEVVKSSNSGFQGGLIMGLPDFSRDSWYGYRIKRNDNEGDVVSFSSHWNISSNTVPVIVNGRTNSFYFRLQGGKVYGSLNGQDVITGASRPYNAASPDEFMLGLGAFNDQNDTVLRYRHVQVRQLSAR